MESLGRQQRACQAMHDLAAVIDNDSRFTVSSKFLDSPLIVRSYTETTRPSTPVDQLIPEWSPHTSKALDSSDSSNSSPATSIGVSLTSTPLTSVSSTPSDYEVKHGQYTTLPRTKALYDTQHTSFADQCHNARSLVHSFPPRHVTATVTAASCLQCSLLNLPCSQTHPTCSRCTRRHGEPLGGFYGLLAASEPCLARRKRTIEELEILDGMQDVSCGNSKHRQKNGLSDREDVLFRLESDGDGDWERKLELADELLVIESQRMERSNWVLPEAPGSVRGFRWQDGNEEGDAWMDVSL